MRRFHTLRNREGKPIDLIAVRARAVSALAGQDLVVAYLHGAYAQGRAGKLSDVDVAVLFGRALSVEQYLERELSLTAILEDLFDDEAIDLSVLNEAPPGFRFQVIKTGVPMFCPDETGRIRFEARTMSEYYDFRPMELEYRRFLFERIKQGRLSG